MRYVLAHSFSKPAVPVAAPVDTGVDVATEVVEVTDKDVILRFLPAGSSAVRFPKVAFVFLAPAGSPLPGDAAGWLESGFANASTSIEVDAAGGDRVLPQPDVDDSIDHLGAIILGYDD